MLEISDVAENGQTFSSFLEARYTVDGTFHRSVCPSGSMEERKRSFNGNYMLYGKVEVSVLPNSLDFSSFGNYPGSVSEFKIFIVEKMACRVT